LLYAQSETDRLSDRWAQWPQWRGLSVGCDIYNTSRRKNVVPFLLVL